MLGACKTAGRLEMKRVKLTIIMAGCATLLVAVSSNAPRAQVIVQPPCCESTPAGRLVEEVNARPPSESYEETSEWLQVLIRTDRNINLHAFLASIEATCRVECTSRLVAANRIVLSEIAAQDARVQGRNDWTLALVSLFAGLIGGFISPVVSEKVVALFRRRSTTQ